MNSQREVIYTRRRHALFGDRISVDIANMMEDIVTGLVNNYQGMDDYEEFRYELIRTLSVESPFTPDQFNKDENEEKIDTVLKLIHQTYKRKEDTIAHQAYPVIKDVYEKQSAVYENIVVPISDGQRVYRVITNLAKAYKTEGHELVRAFERTVILASIDDSWKEHLRELDDLKQSVQNASYEQKDPLLIYKFESFELFRSMIDVVNRSVVSALMKGHIPSANPDAVQKAAPPKRLDLSRLDMKKSDTPGYIDPSGSPDKRAVQPVRVEKKVGRNDPCPCGSGKKYKNCHGAVTA
jgi:preprotein translocase subunit SecA